MPKTSVLFCKICNYAYKNKNKALMDVSYTVTLLVKVNSTHKHC